MHTVLSSPISRAADTIILWCQLSQDVNTWPPPVSAHRATQNLYECLCAQKPLRGQSCVRHTMDQLIIQGCGWQGKGMWSTQKGDILSLTRRMKWKVDKAPDKRRGVKENIKQRYTKGIKTERAARKITRKRSGLSEAGWCTSCNNARLGHLSFSLHSIRTHIQAQCELTRDLSNWAAPGDMDLIYGAMGNEQKGRQDLINIMYKTKKSLQSYTRLQDVRGGGITSWEQTRLRVKEGAVSNYL